MMYQWFWSATTLALICSVSQALGCSGAQEPEPNEPAVEPDVESEEVDDGMAIEGLTGTLRRDEVDPVLNNAARQFQQCYIDAYMDHPYLAGDLAMEFTVAPDGTVNEVWTTTSTMGSQEVEQCILRIAQGLRFPRPHGGEASFDYGPLVMNSEDGHPFELWQLDQLEEQAEAIQQAFSSCTEGSAGFDATLYIGPGGEVRSIGAVAPSAAQAEGARCLEQQLSAIEYPDPGPGTVAKITLEL